MNLLDNPALLDNPTMPNPPANPLMNQFISQDGSATDGNSMPSGEPVHCLASLFSQPLSLLSSLQIWVISALGPCTLRQHMPGFCKLVRHLIHASIQVYFKYNGWLITYYSGGLKLQQLKAQCKSQGLKVGGKKIELVSHLENDDRQKMLSCVLLSQ